MVWFEFKVKTNFKDWKMFLAHENEFGNRFKTRLAYREMFGFMYGMYMFMYSRVCSLLGREFSVLVYQYAKGIDTEISYNRITHKGKEYHLLVSKQQVIQYRATAAINGDNEQAYFEILLSKSNKNRRQEKDGILSALNAVEQYHLTPQMSLKSYYTWRIGKPSEVLALLNENILEFEHHDCLRLYQYCLFETFEHSWSYSNIGKLGFEHKKRYV